MEEMEEEPPTPPATASPFWLSTRTTPRNPLLNTGFHVAVLSIAATVLMAIVTPSLLSQTHQFFRPSSIKRGWDSINLVLVAFAIVCGFLGRKDDNSGTEEAEGSRSSQNVRLGQDYNWRSYGDESNEVRLSSLRRASSSYPDLIRQDMMWDVEYDQRPRFYDDSLCHDVIMKVGCTSEKSPRCTSEKLDGYNEGKEEKESYDVKVIEVDDNVRMNEPPPSWPPAVTPLPPPAVAFGGGRKASIQENERISGHRVKSDGQGRRKMEPRREAQSVQPPPPKGKSVKKSIPLPPPPTKPKDFDLRIGGNGSESPLIPIPPPPFKVPSWKFVVQGDYVKITGSPLRGDDSGGSTPTAAGNTPSPLFFPSPDVNIKADDFIARFRAKLKLEKINSMKHQKQGGINFSPSGSDSNPSPT